MFGLPRLKTMPALLLAMLLVFVLVMTQTLGLIHTITHGSSGSSLHSSDHHHDHDHEHAEVEPTESSHFLAALFSSHQEVSDCRIYDQASHGGALSTAMPSALPVVLPPFTVAIFQGEALARWAALFDARGPPLTV